MPLQQVSVPYRRNVWIQWLEWHFAHHTISKSVVSCLMHAATFEMLVSSCPDNHYYTCFFEREKNPGYSFTTSRWSPLCLWQKVILPGRLFQIRPLMSCHFTEESHNPCPPGPPAVRRTWLCAPSNDSDFRIFLLRMKEAELHVL